MLPSDRKTVRGWAVVPQLTPWGLVYAHLYGHKILGVRLGEIVQE